MRNSKIISFSLIISAIIYIYISTVSFYIYVFNAKISYLSYQIGLESALNLSSFLIDEKQEIDDIENGKVPEGFTGDNLIHPIINTYLIIKSALVEVVKKFISIFVLELLKLIFNIDCDEFYLIYYEQQYLKLDFALVNQKSRDSPYI